MKHKTVIITGASSGIGAALADRFAASGAQLVLAARNAERLREMVARYAAEGIQAVAVEADVSVEADCKRIVDEALAHFDGIDILINNAGISMRALFEGVQLDVLHRLMNVNFWGTVYCTYYALPHLLKRRGSLVGVSSIAGYKGLPGRTGYSASKFAMQGFLEVLRIENLKKGLHVMIACPGFTASNIRNTALASDGTMQGESPREESKMMSAEEVARYIEKGIHQRKRTLILTTQGKLTVLLNKLFPALTDKMVYNHMAKEPGSPFK